MKEVIYKIIRIPVQCMYAISVSKENLKIHITRQFNETIFTCIDYKKKGIKQ